MIMNYNTALEYIDSFINFEKIPRYNYASSFKLERMQALLSELGNPQKYMKIIHIAGSKGKGSTCAIAASLLRQAGYRTGLYISPHLVDMRERISVSDSGLIEKKELSRLIERLKSVAERFRAHAVLGKLSFFEMLTACAFLYFREKQVDFAVLETGLGGRLDATNVAEPVTCGVTNISMEHTDKLGNSLREIAEEKAGIIKREGVVFSAPQEKEVMDVIRGVCRKKSAMLYEVGKDINYSILKSDEKSQVFNMDGPDFSYKDLELNLIGKHQIENAVLAVSIAKKAAEIDEKSVRLGLKDVFWPGRLQVIQKEPYVVLDGAHNVNSIKKAVSSVKDIFTYKRLICIFGVSSDKDIKGISAELDKASDIVILTMSKCASRAEDPVNLLKNFSKDNVKITYNVRDALEKAFQLAGREDLILVTGSLYLVGDAIKHISA